MNFKMHPRINKNKYQKTLQNIPKIYKQEEFTLMYVDETKQIKLAFTSHSFLISIQIRRNQNIA